MTIPLPNPLSTTETVLIGLLLLFFALWGWRHGLDAAIIWGLFVIFAAWAAPQLAVPLGKIFNAIRRHDAVVDGRAIFHGQLEGCHQRAVTSDGSAGQCAGPQ